MNFSFVKLIFEEDKRRKYDQLGRAGLSNGHGHSNYSSQNGYARFSEDFLNRQFHFHNPFDIFEQFMSHFGMDDDFGNIFLRFSERNKKGPKNLDRWSRRVIHIGEKASPFPF